MPDESADPLLRGLTSALGHLDTLAAGAGGELALFLDYDGTLTPIVQHPADAHLDGAVRGTLQRLAGLCRVAIVSGRDLADVRARVGIASLWYAGCHGFELAGPAGSRIEHQVGRDCLPALDAAERWLRRRLAAVPGCRVERKRFALAAHLRQVPRDALAAVAQALEAARAAQPGLRLTRGKEILELRPDLDWNKGRAVRWLLQASGADPARCRPVYIGDDATDEDGFAAVAPGGAGILVARTDRPTRARYRLDDPAAVAQFLERLGERLAGTRPSAQRR